MLPADIELYPKPEPSPEGESEPFFRFRRNCEQLLNMFSLFANEKRLRILCLLNQGDYCVQDIVRLVGSKYSNISQQLKILTLAGYLTRERREKLIYYHLKDQKIKKVLYFLRDQFGED